MPDRVNREQGFPVDGDDRSRVPARQSGALSRLPASAWRWAPWRLRCLGCGEPGADGRDLCRTCDSALPRIRVACTTCGLPLRAAAAAGTGIDAPAAVPGGRCCDACNVAPPPIAHVLAPFLYAAPFDRWLPRFKFHHDLAAGRLLAELMSDACAHAPRPQALVPVPLHQARLRSRGYDQALELATPLSRALSLPLRTGLLQRVRATSAQSSLQARDRHRNLEGAFAVVDGAEKHKLPAHVALVDDVMTTGATLHAAARALLEAGVARVDAWACARVP